MCLFSSLSVTLRMPPLHTHHGRTGTESSEVLEQHNAVQQQEMNHCCCFQSAKSLAIDEIGSRRAGQSFRTMSFLEEVVIRVRPSTRHRSKMKKIECLVLGSSNLFLLCFQQGCIHSKYPDPSHRVSQFKVQSRMYFICGQARIQNVECVKLLNQPLD